MKKVITAFLSFSRVERMGIVVFSVVLLILMFTRATLTLWVHPARNEALERRMASEYMAWKAKTDSANAIANGTLTAQDTMPGKLFSFDPNTLDSAGFIRLGMPPKAVHGLLNWRNKGKRFYKPEDIKPLYNLPPEVYARLAPFIHIAEATEEKQSGFAFKNDYPLLPEYIDLNTADSALLDRGVRGIGATLAHKIIARRTALGGYLRYDQLLEVYKFPDSTFQILKEKLRINPAQVKKLKLNTATLEQLSAHPYIGEKTAKNILLFREGIKRYERIEQLRQVPLMTEEIYRKIAPYCSID